ncbi:sphingosine-1-phosphate phosphatase 1 [Patella vulgata]|uniref:sphingosine-1-phosphate phosphatase 1 n=1 Tax=Patella vulgata TaxID=6465 RepID=UPI00217F35D5|nr:sphingosine-1-phosphate phosphatase 1 [Patella vulgata]
MDLAKRCYEFVSSPEPVASFQKWCSIRPIPAKSEVSVGDKHCNGNCYCDEKGNSEPKHGDKFIKSTTNCKNSSHDIVSNGHFNGINSEYSNLKQRNGGKQNHYLENTKVGNSDINQNGTYFGKEDTQNGTPTLNGYTHTNGKKVTTEPSTGPEFIIGNYLIFALFRFGAELGNEFFYMIFYSFTLWNFDSKICLKIVLVWVLIMYVGQSMKDVIRWPRPASPPVFQLESRYALEYGMPSTHAMVGTAIPYCLLMFTHGRYEYSFEVGICLAISWCTLVCLSRLYLGMHTILDILVGLLSVSILLFILVPWAEVSVLFLVGNKYGGPINVASALALAYFYPTLEYQKWSSARGDTTVFLGVASGLLFGSWLNCQTGLFVEEEMTFPYARTVFEYQMVKNTMGRLVMGVIAIAVMRFIMKLFTFRTLCFIFRKDANDPKSKTCVMIEIPYKYISYFVLAFGASYLAPQIFQYFGMDRSSYYTEIFQ